MVKEYKGELLFLVIAMGAYVFMATLNISQNYSYFAVVFGIFGLIVAWKIYEKVDEQHVARSTSCISFKFYILPRGI